MIEDKENAITASKRLQHLGIAVMLCLTEEVGTYCYVRMVPMLPREESPHSSFGEIASNFTEIHLPRREAIPFGLNRSLQSLGKADAYDLHITKRLSITEQSLHDTGGITDEEEAGILDLCTAGRYVCAGGGAGGAS